MIDDEIIKSMSGANCLHIIPSNNQIDGELANAEDSSFL